MQVFVHVVIGDDKEEAELVKALEEALARRGKITRRLAHSIFIGPPYSGKSSLMDRLLRKLVEKGFRKSTGMCDRAVFVDINRCTIQFATIVDEDSWEEVGYEVSFLKQITQESITISPASDSVSSDSFTKHSESASSLSNSEDKKPTILPKEAENPTPKMHVDDSQGSVSHSTQLQIESNNAIAIMPEQSVSEVISRNLAKLRNRLQKTSSLYLRDIGGQVEFQEMMPLIILGPSIFFFVFRTDQDFQSKFSIDYRKSERESLNCYTSSITIEEALLQCLASVHAMDVPDKDDVKVHQPFVFIIGTHIDQIKSSVSDKITELNRHIDSLIVKHGFQDLVEYYDCHSRSVIFQVDNTSDSDTQFKQIRTKVSRLIWGRPKFAIEFPVDYLFVCLDLQNVKKKILTLSEFRILAARRNIKKEKEVLLLLRFLHVRVGIVRYYDVEGLRDTIVIQPQVLFNIITDLVVETFTCAKTLRDHEVTDFKTKGIVTQSMLECIIDAASDKLPSSSSEDEIISPEVFLRLLVHLRIITPFDQKEKYFIPCVLNHVPEVCGDNLRPDKQIAIRFQLKPDDYLSGSHCPKGLFGVLVTHLLNPEQKFDIKFKLIQDKIFRDKVSFKVRFKGMQDEISLKVYSTHLEISFFPEPAEDRDVPMLGVVCQGVRQIFEVSIDSSLKNLHYHRDRVKPEVCIRCCNDGCSELHLVTEGVRSHRFFCDAVSRSSPIPLHARCWYNEGKYLIAVEII